MPILKTNGLSLSYSEYGEYGSGHPILLIHGSPGTAQAWASVSEILASNYHVYAVDLPGYGLTSPQSAEALPDVGHAVKLINALLERTGPAILAAHSYGGVVALATALQAKSSNGIFPVQALVLFEPVVLGILDMAGDIQFYDNAKTVLNNYIASVEQGDEEAVKQMIDFWFGEGVFERMPELLTAYLIKETQNNVRDIKATFRENYERDKLKKLNMPVTTVTGNQSPEISHRIAQLLADTCSSGQMLTLARANHAMITTHSSDVAEIIARAVVACNGEQTD